MIVILSLLLENGVRFMMAKKRGFDVTRSVRMEYTPGANFRDKCGASSVCHGSVILASWYRIESSFGLIAIFFVLAATCVLCLRDLSSRPPKKGIRLCHHSLYTHPQDEMISEEAVN